MERARTAGWEPKICAIILSLPATPWTAVTRNMRLRRNNLFTRYPTNLRTNKPRLSYARESSAFARCVFPELKLEENLVSMDLARRLTWQFRWRATGAWMFTRQHVTRGTNGWLWSSARNGLAKRSPSRL